MPSGLAAEYRRLMADMPEAQRRALVLERSDKSKTGFTNVIEVKGGKFQARVQVPGDGRGGKKKRRQAPLPGLFDTAIEAAQLLAKYKQEQQSSGAVGCSPTKINKPHKPRQLKQSAAPVAAPPPVELSMALAPPTAVMGMPIPFLMQHAPLVAASPLPMQPLGYTPPFGMRS